MLFCLFVCLLLFFCFGGSQLTLYALLLWVGRCSGALGGVSRLPLQYHGLLAVQDGAGSVVGGHEQAREVLVLLDHVLDAAEGALGVLVDVGPHVGGGWLSLARSLLHETTTPLP